MSGELLDELDSGGDEVLAPGDVVAVRGVSKKFSRTLRRSLAHGMVDLGRNAVGISAQTGVLRTGEFWAVDDVSFTVRRMERVGIIGVNGSGKTTLLRTIAGVFPPDRGEIAVRGRVTALLSVGTGFHPHLTGRENIFLNGAVLGMDRSRIEDRLPEIIDFAELGDFLDSPVSMYSSGMRGRLGFAVSVALDPQLLLLDEVLAVGDVAFKQRCFKRLEEISGRTSLVLVAHLPTHVRRICERVLWMEHGRVIMDGPTDDVLDAYAEAMHRIDDQFATRTGRERSDRDDFDVI